MQKYCREVSIAGFSRVSLQEKPNYDCIFWDEDNPSGGCTIYPARPLQCRSFPFWPSSLADRESWEKVGENCPGIGHGRRHTLRDIQRWARKRAREPFLTGAGQ